MKAAALLARFSILSATARSAGDGGMLARFASGIDSVIICSACRRNRVGG